MTVGAKRAGEDEENMDRTGLGWENIDAGTGIDEERTADTDTCRYMNRRGPCTVRVRGIASVEDEE